MQVVYGPGSSLPICIWLVAAIVHTLGPAGARPLQCCAPAFCVGSQKLAFSVAPAKATTKGLLSMKWHCPLVRERGVPRAGILKRSGQEAAWGCEERAGASTGDERRGGGAAEPGAAPRTGAQMFEYSKPARATRFGAWPGLWTPFFICVALHRDLE